MKKNTSLYLFSLIFILLMFVPSLNVKANDLEGKVLSLETANTFVNAGENFDVYLDVDDLKFATMLSAQIQYDSSKLTLVSAEENNNDLPICKVSSKGKIMFKTKFKDLNVLKDEKRILKLTFKAKEYGGAEVKIASASISNKSKYMTLKSLDSKTFISSKQVTDENVQYSILGSAFIKDDKSIRLVGCSGYLVGGIAFDSSVLPDKGFELKYDYYIGDGTGADGMSVSFSDTIFNLGGTGGALGFNGKYGVEFDTYQNTSDPGYQHIAVLNSSMQHLAMAPRNLRDSKWHKVRISYVPNEIKVYVDNELIVNYKGIDLGNKVYIGIAASIGSYCDNHDIRNVKLSGWMSK